VFSFFIYGQACDGGTEADGRQTYDGLQCAVDLLEEVPSHSYFHVVYFLFFFRLCFTIIE